VWRTNDDRRNFGSIVSFVLHTTYACTIYCYEYTRWRSVYCDESVERFTLHTLTILPYGSFAAATVPCRVKWQSRVRRVHDGVVRWFNVKYILSDEKRFIITAVIFFSSSSARGRTTAALLLYRRRYPDGLRPLHSLKILRIYTYYFIAPYIEFVLRALYETVKRRRRRFRYYIILLKIWYCTGRLRHCDGATRASSMTAIGRTDARSERWRRLLGRPPSSNLRPPGHRPSRA